MKTINILTFFNSKVDPAPNAAAMAVDLIAHYLFNSSDPLYCYKDEVKTEHSFPLFGISSLYLIS